MTKAVIEDAYGIVRAKFVGLINGVICPIDREYVDREPTNDPLLNPLLDMKEAVESRFTNTSVEFSGSDLTVTAQKGGEVKLTYSIPLVAHRYENEDGEQGVELESFALDSAAIAGAGSFNSAIELLETMGAVFTDQDRRKLISADKAQEVAVA